MEYRRSGPDGAVDSRRVLQRIRNVKSRKIRRVIEAVTTFDGDDEAGLPEPVPGGLENALAHYVLAGADALVRPVLDAVADGPKSYTELRPLLKGRNDNALNRVLRWMVDEGLIENGTYPSAPKVPMYQLRLFGRLVRDWVEFYDRVARMAGRAGVEASA